MIVFINTFHVQRENQQRVIDILSDATRSRVSKAPGFHSSTLHRSVDGTKVTMYARWTNMADYEAMRRDPISGEALAGLMALARFEPGLYEVVEEFAPT